MIHPEQVQYAMKHQNLHFFGDAVTELGRLLCRSIRRNGDLTSEGATHSGRKGKHISWIVVPKKITIQPE